MTVFIDVDTQIDFLFPAGALYVPGAETIVPHIAALNRQAPLVISTMDAHAENDPEFKQWPAHCVAGTWPQAKPQATLRDKRVVIPSTPGLPDTTGAEQILLQKQALDCFTNPNLIPLLDRLGAEHCAVYGVVTEICVRYALFGLLSTGRRVELVTDAIRCLDGQKAAEVLSDFTAAGGRLTTVADTCKIGE